MARLEFRITTIHLDPDEDVEAITAVVRNDTLAAIGKLLSHENADQIDVVSSDRGDTEMTVKMPWPVVSALHSAAGTVDPETPEGKAVGVAVYDSLSQVVYGLMQG